MRGRIARVVVLSPRRDRRQLALDALSGPLYSVSLSGGLRDASERKLWAGADVVLMDLVAYEQESPTAAMRWVRAAAPQAALVAMVRDNEERLALKARVATGQPPIFGDEATTARIEEAVRAAWRSTLDPPPPPGRSWDTQECRAIVAAMLERHQEGA